MLSRIASKYGIGMAELRVCAYGEVESDQVAVSQVSVDEGRLCVSDLCEVESDQVLKVSSGIVYEADVESEWLLEGSVEEDVKSKTYEMLCKLCDDLEMCESIVDIEVKWLRAISMECMSLCKSDAILNSKYEEAVFRYGVMSESFERGSSGVEESKSEVIMEESVSLMEESYLYGSMSSEVCVPRVEVPRVEVPRVEVSVVPVVVVETAAVVSKKAVKEKVVKEKVVKAKVVKVPPVCASESVSVSACASEVVLSGVLSAGEASSSEVAGVAKKVAKDKPVKEKVVKEKQVKEKPVKEKKVKESVYRGGIFASLVTESVTASESREEESKEEESSSVRGSASGCGEDELCESLGGCYIVSKKEAAMSAAMKMSSDLPKLKRK